MAHDMTDLILKEYEHFSESFWRNEEVGEKRVNYYLGLITAVFAGLIALATSEFAEDHALATLMIIAVSEAALLALGVVTYQRMKKRNQVSDEYKDILRGLREEFCKECRRTEPYVLRLVKNGRSFWGGGLATMVLAINAIIVLALLATSALVAYRALVELAT